ncbi:putative reverse transcriptase domain-containing protein, partial [Tanacetum coccineum]
MADSDPEEDPEEDHTDYPADGGDGDDEPSDDDDDDDDEDEEPFEDEDDDVEEDEHLAPADSSVIPIVDLVPSAGDTKAFETDESAPTPRSPQTKVPFAQIHLRKARKTVRLEPPMSASMEARIAEHAAAPTPPLPVASPPLPLPSPLTTSPTDAGAPLGYRAAGIRMRAASPPLLLPSTSHRTDIPRLRCRLGRERTTLEADLRRDRVMETGYGITDTWDEIVEAMLEVAPTTLEEVNQRVTKLATTVRQENEEDRPYHRHTAMILDREAMYARIAWTSSEDRSATLEAHVATLIAQTSSLQTQLTTTLRRIETLEARDLEPQDEPAEAGSSFVYFTKIPPKRRTSRASPAITTTPTSTPIPDAQLRKLIERGIAAVLAERDADRSRNGDDNHDSGISGRRQASTICECTYTNFLKCQPMNFKGTEGVFRLTQWIEKMESVFHISNCTVACQVKFATCTLQGNDLTWWNSYVQAIGHDTAYAMPWKTLNKMITDKYCLRSEIKKLETEMWNLKVKGTDVMSYNQRFLELVLMCDRMFPEESDVVEKYVGGLP